MTDTQTATAHKSAAQTQQPDSKSELAVFSPPRLPFHPAIEERFGVDKGQWKALVEAVFPAAKTPDAVALALSYCKARKLDPFKRVVHIVPIWDSNKTPGDKGRAKGGYVETVWPGIAEHRTTAARTGQHAGLDPARFGPMIEEVFSLDSDEDGQVRNITVKFPEWCEITVYRLVQGTRCAFPGPRVYWREIYSRIGKSKVPNEKWQRSPAGMLEKTAEAGALRRAFPEEIGDESTAEEAGAVTHPIEVTEAPARPTREQFKETAKAAETDFLEVDSEPAFAWVSPDGDVTDMDAETFEKTMLAAINEAKPDRMAIVWENNSGQIAKLEEKVALRIRDAMDARATAEQKAKADAAKPAEMAKTAEAVKTAEPAKTEPAKPAAPSTLFKLPYGPTIDLAVPAELPLPSRADYPGKGALTAPWVAGLMHVADKAPAGVLIDWYNMNKSTVDQVKKINPSVGANIDAAFQRRCDEAAKPEPKTGLFEDDAPDSLKRT